jgi:hypothetical protein
MQVHTQEICILLMINHVPLVYIVQTSLEAHPASYKIYTRGCSPRAKCRHMKLTIRIRLVQGLSVEPCLQSPIYT